ncbi:hypothetical protein SAMN03159382_05469 [Pseudomonas sp. NFACC23-1]|nr:MULTISPECIES: hypothetical protein [unclassified Pseudomonas]SDB64662.1 hypothetical protein SAMN03159386_05453 [Pseudomonas sp. NFACC17-2]SEJ93857.1 hypothetical protein SAMN03159382_05469 [Pseudomonas sp. NFACC23-1]SFW92767.1 hypothetical protein SAMN05660640_05672 [Pseudomonas sp. NFACC16-2]
MSSKDKKVDVGFKGTAKATLKPEAVAPEFKGAAQTTLKPETTPEDQTKP